MMVGELREMLDGVPDDYDVEVNLLVDDTLRCPECGGPSSRGRCLKCRGRSMIDPGADE